MDNLSFGFTFDDHASAGLKSISQALSGIIDYLDDVNSSMNVVSKESFSSLKTNVSKACSSIGLMEQGFSDAAGKAGTLNKTSLGNLSKSVSQASSAVNSLSSTANQSSSKLGKLNNTTLGKAINTAKQLAQNIKNVGNESNDTEKDVNSLGDKFDSLTSKVKTLVGTYVGVKGIKGALDWSDEISNTTSRLNMVVNDFNKLNGSSQNVDGLKNSIFQAAQASRSSYSTMQNMVASLGQQTKGVFGNTDEIVNFSRVLNLGFKAAGTGAQQADAAMLQLTQALTSGRLQGDELVSLRENASFLVNTMAEGLGVTTEQFFEMASAGEITSDKVVSSIMNMQGKITEQASQIKYTFSDVWTEFTNATTHAFEPVAQELGQLANSPELQASMNQLADTVNSLAPKIKDMVAGLVTAAPGVIEKIVNAFSWITEHGDQVTGIIGAIATAILTFKTFSTVTGIMTTLGGVLSGMPGILGTVGTALTALSGPIGLAILAVGAITAGIVYLWNTNEGFRNAVISIWNGIKDTIVNAWNSIMGFFDWLPKEWDAEINRLQNLGSTIASIFSGWYNSALSWGADLLQGFRDGLTQKWNDITSWFSSSWDWIVNNVKNFFGIHSPSTLFADIGANLINGLWEGLKSVWSGLTSWIGDAWNSIKNIFTGGGNDTTVDYSAMIAQTQEQIQQLQAVVSQGFLNIMAQIQSIMAQITAQTVASFTTMGQAMTASLLAQTTGAMLAMQNQTTAQVMVMVETLGAIVMGLNGIFLSAFNLISIQSLKVLETLKNATINVLGELSQGVTSVMTVTQVTAVNIVSRMAQMVINLFTSLGSTAVNLITTMARTLISVYTNLVSQLIALMTVLASRITAIVAQMVSQIARTIGTLPAIFRSTGINMMTSLRQGIESQRSQVISTVGTLVQMLKSTFEQGLGIHSPSDYMIWVGQMLLAGLIQGMNSKQISSFIGSIINDMRTSFKNGKFNAEELVDYLGADSSLNVVKYLELIGDQTVSDMFGDGGVPAIIQEALKYVGYAPGGGNSMFGLHYGNAGAWCASFVRYCAEQVGVPFPPTNYVPDVLDWSIANGRYTQTPQAGYAAIFGGGSHIELVAGVGADGTVDMVGGNTGMGEVKHRPRNDATSYVALDGGHSTMTLKDTIMRAWNKKYNPMALMLNAGGSNVAYNPSAGVEQWRSTVMQALAMLGQPASLADGVLYAIQSESGGDPNAVNNYDINAQRGDPSRGLLQTIGSTFEAYRNPSLSNNIFDPLANIYAALNYMIQRYGSIGAVVNPRMGNWYGYEVGTRYVPADMVAMLHKGEAVIPAGQNPYKDSGGDYLADLYPNYSSSSTGGVTISMSITQNVTDSSNPQGLANEVIDVLYTAMEEQLYSSGGVENEY